MDEVMAQLMIAPLRDDADSDGEGGGGAQQLADAARLAMADAAVLTPADLAGVDAAVLLASLRTQPDLSALRLEDTARWQKLAHELLLKEPWLAEVRTSL
jgi:hypothetical protein